MAATGLETFLDNLERSNLLTPEQLRAVRQLAGTLQPNEVAQQLVQRGWLTRWQARMLLAGHHAFFLGRYKLLDHLGEGGMGSVFQAEQAPLGRVVAVKVLSKRQVDNSEAVARFRREIRAVAALDHPHIVRAFDADTVGDRHFLVMEFVPGNDLGALVQKEGRLPIGEACEYIRQAALGLVDDRG